MRSRAPMSFFLRGAGALALLFLLTLMMTSSPEVNALRGLIAVGLAIVGVKMLLRHYNVDWPSKRH
jgi:hypothetical protein